MKTVFLQWNFVTGLNLQKYFSFLLQGGVDNSEGIITGYVLASLLISGFNNQTVLNDALACLSNNQDTSLYATFLYAYAEALAGKGDSAKIRIESVKEKAITKGIYFEFVTHLNPFSDFKWVLWF